MIVIFDIETGGTNLQIHPLIQIAAVSVTPSFEIRSEFERKILFDVSTADPEALRMNTYSKTEHWDMEAVPEKKALEDFQKFLSLSASFSRVSKKGNTFKVSKLAGYNSTGFDVPWIQSYFRKHNLFLPADNRSLDVLHLAISKLFLFEETLPNMQLSTVAKHFGVETPDAHDALGDVRTTAKVLQKLL